MLPNWDGWNVMFSFDKHEFEKKKKSIEKGT